MATQNGLEIQIGNHFYYISPSPQTRLPLECLEKLQAFDADVIPATAINWDRETFSEDDLEAVYLQFAEKDDVWSYSFTQITLLLHSTLLKQVAQTRRTIFNLDRSEVDLPQGPYVVKRSTGEVYAVYLICSDTYHAFLESIVHENVLNGELKTYASVRSTNGYISVPLPSRLYFSPCSNKPLKGLRFAVKDTIDLRGFRTGYGSAAYRSTYPPAREHAPCVQTLFDAGAVVVGITKSTEFAEGTDPHEWIESECPYNPRGDGQQKPSASSTGSAVATAAYEWIDFTLGTDTGGSIRHPAGVNGIFGSRMTQGAIDLKGVLGATDLLNTVGCFARDATIFGDVGRQLLPPIYQPTVPFTQRRYKLLYPIRALINESPDQFRWFPNPNDNLDYTDAEKQMEAFVKKLESHLNCERVCFNIDTLWRETRPKGQPESLDQAVGHIYSTLTAYFAATACVDQFCLDYAAQNDGLEPKITAIVKDRLDHGRKLSKSQVSNAIQSMQIFADWAEKVMLGAYDEEAIALMIFPQSFGIPDYRYDIIERKELFKDGFSIYAFGYLVGCPDYTVPVGQVPYLSEVSKKIEQLPTSISMIARPGSDIPLFDILRSLEEKGDLSPVKAGSTM